MRVIARPVLIRFIKRHRDAEGTIKAWYQEARRAHWKTANELKQQYANASILRNGRVVFNLAGNKYRLIVGIHFDSKLVFIRFIGTHLEYDLIDAETI